MKFHKLHNKTYGCDIDGTMSSRPTRHKSVHINSQLCCGICGEKFTGDLSFEVHLLTHGDKKPYCCNICSETFTSENILHQHQKIHKIKNRCLQGDMNGKKSHICEVCAKECKTQRLFSKHMEIHFSQTHDVSSTISVNNTFMEHSKNQHSETKMAVHACDVCQKTFNTNQKLVVHKKIHKPLKCKVCFKNYSKDEFKQHAERHKGKSTTVSKCDICSKEFSSHQKLSVHMISHKSKYTKHQSFHKKEHDVFTCEFCHKEFISEIKFKSHAAQHDPARPYGCNVCGKFFDDEKFAQTHRTLHKEKVRQECDICGKVYMERIFFDIHRMTHFEQKPFKCDICDDIFTEKTTFLRHRNNHKIRPNRHAERFLEMREVLKIKLTTVKQEN